MDYEKVIHSFIDELILTPSNVKIVINDEGNKDVIITIYAENEDTARLIGKHGSIANALREVVSIAGKEDNKHVHLHFENLESIEEK